MSVQRSVKIAVNRFFGIVKKHEKMFFNVNMPVVVDASWPLYTTWVAMSRL